MADDSFIRREMARMQKQIEERDQAWALIAANVAQPGEVVDGRTIIERVQRACVGLVDREKKLANLERAVRALGGCDVDATGACHTHGYQTAPCPVGFCLGLCREVRGPAVAVPARGASA